MLIMSSTVRNRDKEGLSYADMPPQEGAGLFLVDNGGIRKLFTRAKGESENGREGL